MEYKRIYDMLTAKTEQPTVPYTSKKVYKRGFEVHHIIPRCMGGSDDASNLCYLPVREHIFAHLLLVKMYPGNKKLLSAAVFMMSRADGTKYKSSRLAAQVRAEWIESQRSIKQSEHKKIVDMYMVTPNASAIAEELEYDHGSVLQVLREGGVDTRRKARPLATELAICEDYKNGVKTEHIVDTYCLPGAGTVADLVRKHGGTVRSMEEAVGSIIKEEDQQKVIDLYNKTKNAALVARETGWGDQAVRNCLERNGIVIVGKSKRDLVIDNIEAIKMALVVEKVGTVEDKLQMDNVTFRKYFTEATGMNPTKYGQSIPKTNLGIESAVNSVKQVTSGMSTTKTVPGIGPAQVLKHLKAFGYSFCKDSKQWVKTAPSLVCVDTVKTFMSTAIRN